MAREMFERTIEVQSDVERCWAVLTDVEQLVSWVHLLHSAQEVEFLRSYTAVLEDSVGPFNLRADLAIDVEVVDELAAIDAKASGRDRALNSRIDITGGLRLEPGGEGVTRVTISGSYQVTGRATSLGAGIVRKKGDAAVEEFVSNAARALGPVTAAG